MYYNTRRVVNTCSLFDLGPQNRAGCNVRKKKKRLTKELKEEGKKELHSRASVEYCDSQGCELKKLLNPARRITALKYAVVEHHVAERRAYRVLHINRNRCRYEPAKRSGEDEIRTAIIRLVTNYGRVGYRMVTYLLRNEGVLINYKRVERIWREKGLKLPKKQIMKRRLYGSCILSERRA